MTDGGHVQAPLDALQAAAAARTERDRLHRQRATTAQETQRLDLRLAELRATLADETADVEALESLSFTRVWAGLKGSRGTDLQRETAERDAAQYAVAEAEARAAAARRHLEDLDGQLDRLGDVDAAWERALAARETELERAGGEAGRRLSEVAERRGELGALAEENTEAAQAGRDAERLLGQALDELGGARSWAAWDTFGGGGMLSDMMKYDRLDRVTALVRDADVALGRFARELADVGIVGLGGVEIGELMRTFDFWFDNFFTDLAVRSRIIEAEERVGEAHQAVRSLLGRLSDDAVRIDGELASLAAERERLAAG